MLKHFLEFFHILGYKKGHKCESECLILCPRMYLYLVNQEEHILHTWTLKAHNLVIKGYGIL